MAGPEEDIDLNDPEVQKAATKIQATFRGHKTRKEKDQKEEEVKHNNKHEEEVDINLSEPGLNDAAVKIQATFRGHKVRKETKLKEHEDEITNKMEALNTRDGEELDIDLDDPDLQKAATKIQASFRGHMTRKVQAQ